MYWFDQYQNPYLDFTSANGVMPIGWGYDKLTHAASDQCYTYPYLGPYGSAVEWRQVLYASAISERFPEVDGEPQQVLFCISSDQAKAIALQMVSESSGRVLLPHQVMEGQLRPDDAAVAMEFVASENGFVRLDTGLAQQAAAVAKDMGVPIIAGEHQTGYGRCGTFLAQEEWGVQADITILGESGGGGFAFGAIVAPAKYFRGLTLPPLVLPGIEVACAAGLVVLQEICEPVLDNVRAVGQVIEDSALELKGQFPEVVLDCNGFGLARGLVVTNSDVAHEIVVSSRKKGMILSVCNNRPDVIRLTPPLIIAEDEAKRGMDIIASACMDI